MWIEIKIIDINCLIQTDKLQAINIYESGIRLIFSIHEMIDIETVDSEQATVIYTGFKMALNGLDFKYGEDYIRPLMRNKQKALYEYMMQKEFEDKRT